MNPANKSRKARAPASNRKGTRNQRQVSRGQGARLSLIPLSQSPGGVLTLRPARSDRGFSETMAGSFGTHLNEKIRALPDDVQRVIRSFTLPSDSDPERIATAYSGGLTAVAGPWRRSDLKFYLGGASNPSFPVSAHLQATNMFLFQFRDAIRHTVRYDTTQSNSSYVVNFAGLAGPTVTRTLPAQGENAINALWAAYSTGYDPHGPILYPGYSSKTNQAGLRFFWCDSVSGASTIVCTFDALLINQLLDITLWRWGVSGIEVANKFEGLTIPLTSATFTLNAAAGKSGYYGLSYKTYGANPAPVTNFGVQLNFITTDYYAHRSIPGLELNLAAVDGTIITACSHTVTNKSAILSKQGQIAQYQIPQGTDWTTLVLDGSVPYDALSSFNGAATRTGELGCYTWMKPTQPTDFSFVSEPSSDGGFCKSAKFSLDTPSAYIGCAMSIGEVGGRGYYVTECAHVTYQTQDVWRVLSEPDVSRQSYEMAMDHLKHMSQYFENENHFVKIFGDIKKFVRQAIPYMEKALPYVAKYGPMAVKALSSL
jgi:hypothetical protein